ncbi:hypothetical protein [Oceanicaulis sp. MMSF_3324]|uniref:hypothetical protein n=1 Tax=Oceanicaulis sp. MMSF_3324 TaxID=3046702 RepID=UPI00273D2DCB|nr:hypothetical protein [Oceanicaulis sp. MMSF_3324]
MNCSALRLALLLAFLTGPSQALVPDTPFEPYLGQEPPGAEPVAFAPGLVSSPGYEYGVTISPDMDAFYFIQGREDGEGQNFVVVRPGPEGWTPEVISARVGQPFVSPDGETLHLGRRFMTRKESGWSDIQTLGAHFEDYAIMRLTASRSGTYIFDEIGSSDGDGLIRISRLVDGERQTPVPLGPAINTGRFNAHPFIAPDESYILFDGRREHGEGHSDIYVSFRQSDGEWGEAINLGAPVNTQAWEASASVSPDGRYLFFHRMVSEGEQAGLPNVDIMWVDASVIDELRPD